MKPLTVAGLCAGLAAGAVRADDNILRGPHPFLRDNDLTVHGGYAIGFGDTFAGPKAAVDYGYRIGGGLWLDIGVGYLAGACFPALGQMGCARDGDAVEVLAGVKQKLRMNVPVVPYTKLAVGLAYLFPQQAASAVGVMLRGGVGAKYFPYDWIGVGVEATLSIGRAGYHDDTQLSRTIAGLDVLGGAEVQF